MEALVVENLTFRYPGRDGASLSGVNLSVQEGEFLLIGGSTGSGKSTLGRCLNGLIPAESAGTMKGRVLIGGKEAGCFSFGEMARRVGLVFQSPDDQIFSTMVEDEVAFGMENLCFDPAVMNKRIEEVLSAAGLPGLRKAASASLSGGQKQRLAVASVLAMQPKILVLDEPTSQLDPRGSRELLETLENLNKNYGVTIILIEHRIHQAARYAQRLVLLHEGRVVLDGKITEVFRDIMPFREVGVRLPETVEIASALNLTERPLDVEALAGLISKRNGGFLASSKRNAPGDVRERPCLLRAENLSFGYEKERPVLKGFSMQAREGEPLAILGGNGAGKSTLLSLIAGLHRPWRGRLEVLGKDLSRRRGVLSGEVALLLQNPDLMLIAPSVEEEIAFGPKNLGLSQEEVSRRVRSALGGFRIERFRKDDPLSLSRGERLRVAVAATVALKPKVLLLDEPTTGQDFVSIEAMMAHLFQEEPSSTLIFCTHDVATAARYARRIVLTAGGKVIAEGTPEVVFRDEDLLREASLEPPAVFKLSERLGLGPCLSVDEFVKRLRG